MSIHQACPSIDLVLIDEHQNSSHCSCNEAIIGSVFHDVVCCMCRRNILTASWSALSTRTPPPFNQVSRGCPDMNGIKLLTDRQGMSRHEKKIFRALIGIR